MDSSDICSVISAVYEFFLRIFESNVKSALLYGCETWKSRAEIKNSVQAFLNMCLRKILRLRWPESITNE